MGNSTGPEKRVETGAKGALLSERGQYLHLDFTLIRVRLHGGWESSCLAMESKCRTRKSRERQVSGCVHVCVCVYLCTLVTTSCLVVSDLLGRLEKNRAQYISIYSIQSNVY